MKKDFIIKLLNSLGVLVIFISGYRVISDSYAPKGYILIFVLALICSVIYVIMNADDQQSSKFLYYNFKISRSGNAGTRFKKFCEKYHLDKHDEEIFVEQSIEKMMVQYERDQLQKETQKQYSSNL